MNGNIIFCKDGILRFRFNKDKSVMIPLILIQKHLKEDDYPFFLNQLKKIAILEKGSTVGTFLLALEPWAEVVKNLIGSDVPAYINTVRKPSKLTNEFDSVIIQKVTSVRRHVNLIIADENMDVLDWMNDTKTRLEPSDDFKINSVYDVSGYDIGDANNYSMSNVSIEKLKNVPLVFSDTHYLTTQGKSKTEPGHLLNIRCKGVHKEKNHYYIEGKVNINLHDILDAVINNGLIHYSPQEANEKEELVNEALSAINNMIESGVTNEDSVIDDYSDESIDYEMKEWNDILSNVDKNSRYPIKIGDIEQDIMKEKRLNDTIIKSL